MANPEVILHLYLFSPAPVCYGSEESKTWATTGTSTWPLFGCGRSLFVPVIHLLHPSLCHRRFLLPVLVPLYYTHQPQTPYTRTCCSLTGHASVNKKQSCLFISREGRHKEQYSSLSHDKNLFFCYYQRCIRKSQSSKKRTPAQVFIQYSTLKWSHVQ